MTITITPDEFQLFRRLIEEKSGICLGEDKMYLVENRLAGLMARTGCRSFGALYQLTRNRGQRSAVLLEIIDAITTNETSWFRDQRQFDALKSHILPEMTAKLRQGDRQRIDIWSAACATGQEPYSIAMAVADYCDHLREGRELLSRFRILATDISPSAVRQAQCGVYYGPSLRGGLQSHFLRRHFTCVGDDYTVRDHLKNMIEFRTFNLKDAYAGMGPFDLAFLRNVIIYFSDELKKDVYQRVARVLRPDGYLFLGAAESIGSHSQAFVPATVAQTTAYRLKPGLTQGS
jgi:chemotaxis protein methyltransferase CheR